MCYYTAHLKALSMQRSVTLVAAKIIEFAEVQWTSLHWQYRKLSTSHTHTHTHTLMSSQLERTGSSTHRTVLELARRDYVLVCIHVHVMHTCTFHAYILTHIHMQAHDIIHTHKHMYTHTCELSSQTVTFTRAWCFNSPKTTVVMYIHVCECTQIHGHVVKPCTLLMVFACTHTCMYMHTHACTCTHKYKHTTYAYVHVSLPLFIITLEIPFVFAHLNDCPLIPGSSKVVWSSNPFTREEGSGDVTILVLWLWNVVILRRGPQNKWVLTKIVALKRARTKCVRFYAEVEVCTASEGWKHYHVARSVKDDCCPLPRMWNKPNHRHVS